MSKDESTDPKVIIPEKVLHKIMYWVNKSPVEISGLGRVKLDKGVYTVLDAHLLEQENTATTTDIDAAAAAKLMFQMKDEDGYLNFWWHSHVNMGVFWSGTDTTTIREFGAHGFCLATVFNKKGERKSAYYQGGTDFYPETFIDNLETIITREVDTEKEKIWEAEYKLKCKETKFVPKQVGYYADRDYNRITKTWMTVPEYNIWAIREGEPLKPTVGKRQAQSTKKSKTGKTKHKTNSTVLTKSSGTTTCKNLLTQPMVKDHANIPPEFVQYFDMEWVKNCGYSLLTVDASFGNMASLHEGDIHPEFNNMRYCASTKGWITYEKYAAAYGSTFQVNVLDYLDIRHEWATYFEEKLERPPADDYDIDRFYMLTRGFNEVPFYDPGTWVLMAKAAQTWEKVA